MIEPPSSHPASPHWPVRRNVLHRWPGRQPCEARPREGAVKSFGSGGAVDRDGKGSAYLPHPSIPKPAETIDEDSDRHALHRIQIHRGAARHRVVTGLKDDLAGQATDCRCTRRHQCPSQPGNGSVARQDDNWAPAGFREFTPPNLAARRYRHHVAAAAWRNSARLPHSSGSSSGCLS